MNGQDYLLLDVFTDRPLEGNPVAIFLKGDDLTRGEAQ